MYAKLEQICLTCKQPDKEFYDYEHEKSCKECMSAARRAHYKAKRDSVLKRVRKYRKGNPDKIKHTKLMQTYGISFAEYNVILASQNGVCAVCEREERAIWRGQKTRLAVDHDHSTGAVRGLLCQKCNRALGLLEENVRHMARLIEYIEKFKSQG